MDNPAKSQRLVVLLLPGLLPGPLLPAAGALIITAVELAVGLAVNRDRKSVV